MYKGNSSLVITGKSSISVEWYYEGEHYRLLFNEIN